MDAKMLAEAAYDCRGDVYLDTNTGQIFDPKKHGYDMSPFGNMSEPMPWDSSDTLDKLAKLCNHWSLALSDATTYLHVQNDGNTVSVGMAKTDVQMQLDRNLFAAFEEGAKHAADISQPDPKPAPVWGASPAAPSSVADLFSQASSRNARGDFGLGD